jgi:hypothetical protein
MRRTETWSVSPSVDILPFGVTIPATVPQGSEIPEGLMNNPVYFVKHLYMFQAYLGPSSGGTTVCIQKLVLILFRIIISTNCCIHTVVPPEEGPRYASNM